MKFTRSRDFQTIIVYMAIRGKSHPAEYHSMIKYLSTKYSFSKLRTIKSPHPASLVSESDMKVLHYFNSNKCSRNDCNIFTWQKLLFLEMKCTAQSCCWFKPILLSHSHNFIVRREKMCSLFCRIHHYLAKSLAGSRDKMPLPKTPNAKNAHPKLQT